MVTAEAGLLRSNSELCEGPITQVMEAATAILKLYSSIVHIIILT